MKKVCFIFIGVFIIFSCTSQQEKVNDDHYQKLSRNTIEKAHEEKDWSLFLDSCASFEETYKNDFEIMYWIGEAFHETGNNNKALYYYTLADKLNPNDLWTIHWIADCYWRMGNYQLCLQYAEIVIELDNNFGWGYHKIIGSLIELKNYEEALRYIEIAKNKDLEYKEDILRIIENEQMPQIKKYYK